MAEDEAVKLLREIRDDQRAVLVLLQQARDARAPDPAGARLLRGLLWVAVPVGLLWFLLRLWPSLRYMVG